jgi:hypothetical protein
MDDSYVRIPSKNAFFCLLFLVNLWVQYSSTEKFYLFFKDQEMSESASFLFNTMFWRKRSILKLCV